MEQIRQHQTGLGNDRGMALLGALLALLIVTLLGMTSLNLVSLEIQGAASVQKEKVAYHLAEAATDQVVRWFHDPASVPVGTTSRLFTKQFELPESGSSFFNANGRSQFTGTAERPDVVFDAANPVDDQRLNSATTGWFRSLRGLGRILKLKVYGPSRPGLLCTVQATASASYGAAGIARTISFQLGTQSIPPIRAGIQSGGTGTNGPGASALPVWVHWGDVKISGDVLLRKHEDVPVKSGLASVTGQSYAEMSYREDRWLDMWVGGAVMFSQPASSGTINLGSNLHTHQEPTPGLKMDRWEYESLKKAALMYGSYYVMDREGLLYANGVVEPGKGIPAGQVFTSLNVGDHHGLVFVDTLDQQAPRVDNLGTVVMDADYAEGLFVVNAHVVLKSNGSGRSVPALSPPSEGISSLGARIPVQLTGIHVRGALYVSGNMTFQGHPRVYGAIVTEGYIGVKPPSTETLEVWFDHDLASGLVRGLPLVYVAPGTRQVNY